MPRFVDGESGTIHRRQWPQDGASITIANAAGDVRPFSSALDQFNYGPYNFYQRPQEDYQANAFAHYDLFAGDDKR